MDGVTRSGWTVTRKVTQPDFQSSDNILNVTPTLGPALSFSRIYNNLPHSNSRILLSFPRAPCSSLSRWETMSTPVSSTRTMFSWYVLTTPPSSLPMTYKKTDPLPYLQDQPLLRLPYELLRNNFRAAHFTVEKDSTAVKSLLRETASAAVNGKATPDQILKNLDTMIAKMRGVKRKLTTYADEEARLHHQSGARIAHLGELYSMHGYDDVKYETWSRKRLDRLLVDYLLRSGYGQSARALTDEKVMDDLVDVQTFQQVNKIQESLRKGSVAEALAWCQDNKKELRKMEVRLPYFPSDILVQVPPLTGPNRASSSLSCVSNNTSSSSAPRSNRGCSRPLPTQKSISSRPRRRIRQSSGRRSASSPTPRAPHPPSTPTSTALTSGTSWPTSSPPHTPSSFPFHLSPCCTSPSPLASRPSRRQHATRPTQLAPSPPPPQSPTPALPGGASPGPKSPAARPRRR